MSENGSGLSFIPGYKEKEFVWKDELEKLPVNSKIKGEVRKECLAYKNELAEFIDYAVSDAKEGMLDDVDEVRGYFETMFAGLSERMLSKYNYGSLLGFYNRMFKKDRERMKGFLDNLEVIWEDEIVVSSSIQQTNLLLSEMKQDIRLGKFTRIDIEQAYKAALREVESNEVYTENERSIYASRRVSGVICMLISELLERERFDEAEKRLKEYGKYISEKLKGKLIEKIDNEEMVAEGIKRILTLEPLEAESYYLSVSLGVRKRIDEKVRLMDQLEIESQKEGEQKGKEAGWDTDKGGGE